MASNNNQSQNNWKGLIIGISLGKLDWFLRQKSNFEGISFPAGLANVVYLSNIFSVGYFKLAPFEIGLVKGIFQTFVFSISALPWTMWKEKIMHKGKNVFHF